MLCCVHSDIWTSVSTCRSFSQSAVDVVDDSISSERCKPLYVQILESSTILTDLRSERRRPVIQNTLESKTKYLGPVVIECDRDYHIWRGNGSHVIGIFNMNRVELWNCEQKLLCSLGCTVCAPHGHNDMQRNNHIVVKYELFWVSCSNGSRCDMFLSVP